MVGSWLEKVAGLKTVSDLAVSVLEIDKELFSGLPVKVRASKSLFRSTQLSEHAIEKIQVHRQYVRKTFSASHLEC
jgi:hypothetical protein